nr:hypothetical protein [Bacillaceae bacterium]
MAEAAGCGSKNPARAILPFPRLRVTSQIFPVGFHRTGHIFSYTDTTFPSEKVTRDFGFREGQDLLRRNGKGGKPAGRSFSRLEIRRVFRPSDFESQTEVAHPARSFSVCGSLSVFAASFTVSFRVSSLPPGFTIGVTSNPEGYRPSIGKPESCGQGAVSHPNERLKTLPRYICLFRGQKAGFGPSPKRCGRIKFFGQGAFSRRKIAALLPDPLSGGISRL